MQVVHIWLSHLKRTGWPLQVLKIGFVFAFFAWFFKPPMAQADLPHGSAGKESACSAGDVGLITGLRRSPGEGNGNLLQYSCLENPMDRGAWQTTVHGAAKSQTWLSNWTTTTFNPLHNHISTWPCSNMEGFQIIVILVVQIMEVTKEFVDETQSLRVEMWKKE